MLVNPAADLESVGELIIYTANVDVQNLNTYFERLNVAITERVTTFIFCVNTGVKLLEH